MKSLIPGLVESITKEKIEKLYIDDNLKKEEVASRLGITMWTLSKLLKYYEIAKDFSLIVQKRQATCLQKYGVDNPRKSPDIKQKMRQTTLEKYGAAYYMSTEAGKEKVKQTKQERYGASNYNNKEKMAATKLERYGDASYNNREKMRETMQERYGVDNPFQLRSTVDTIREIKNNRLGYSEIFKEMFNDREKAIEFLGDKKYTFCQLSNILNIPYYIVSTWVARLDLRDYIDYSYSGTSGCEDEVEDYLKSLGLLNIQRQVKYILDRAEIDIYLPDLKLGIKFNGMYWHGSLFKDKNYHQWKSKAAEAAGIRLIHIYSYEWNDPVMQTKVKELLRIACGKVEKKIYARNCEIRKITNREAKPFNEANHLQGHRNAQVTYGLYYQGELVQLMSFSRTRYNRNLKEENSWEIIRGCPGSNNIVVGGVSKLFKHFVEDYKPSSVFSYCDFNKFDGRGYEAIGMQFIGYTKPDLKYVIHGHAVNRNPKNYQENKANCDYTISGAGSKKYLIKFE